MSPAYLSAELRRLVSARAGWLCEYCLVHTDDTFFGGHVDHILSQKHGGATDETNLALACSFCNRSKGSDIASLVPGTNELVRLFHPRTDRWHQHFRLDSDGVTILPLTPVGEATARLLGFNHDERLLERQALSQAGRYPSPAAWERMHGKN